jgi:hypothetical protein
VSGNFKPEAIRRSLGLTCGRSHRQSTPHVEGFRVPSRSLWMRSASGIVPVATRRPDEIWGSQPDSRSPRMPKQGLSGCIPGSCAMIALV